MNVVEDYKEKQISCEYNLSHSHAIWNLLRGNSSSSSYLLVPSLKLSSFQFTANNFKTKGTASSASVALLFDSQKLS